MKLGTLLSAFACMALSMGFATPAKAEDPIKIGVYMPLTGQNAFAGQLELEGIQLAHKITPTVLGRPVELVVVDNKSDKVEAANAVKRLAERDNVTAIIGTYASSLSLAGGEVAERAKVPVLATSSTNPLVTQGKKYYFRACFIDPYQGAAAVACCSIPVCLSLMEKAFRYLHPYATSYRGFLLPVLRIAYCLHPGVPPYIESYFQYPVSDGSDMSGEAVQQDQVYILLFLLKS